MARGGLFLSTGKEKRMGDILQEFCDSRGVSVRIDREAGVIRGVKILGLESRNGRRYLPEALAAAVPLYEDAKVNVNHPKGNPSAPRDYQDRIGAIRQVTLRDGEGLFADFHFNPKHALAEQLLWDAEHAPENVGFSHNVEARIVRRGEQLVVEAIMRVQSVDLVADPATSRSLFEAVAGGDAKAPASTEPEAFSAGDGGANQEAARLPAVLEQRDHELQSLRREVERLRALESAAQRRGVACRLIGEAGLPDPNSQDPWDRLVCGEIFFEALLAAADEQVMRHMVGERARLARAARCPEVPLQAMDQHRAAQIGSGRPQSFIEAIT